MKGKEKNYQKGITLIALVITIIVLLILAGVTLSIVFNGGIIDKSQNAVDKYSKAQQNETEIIDYIDKKFGQSMGIALDNINGIKNEKLIEQTDDIKKYCNPVIPVGFKTVNTETASWEVVEDEALGKIVKGWNDGLVIEDKEGNQFVWVPVDGTNVKYEKWCKGFNYSNSIEFTDDTQAYPDGIEEDNQIMKYQGFYVARYEAGIPSDGKLAETYTRNVYGIPVSKRNQIPWNYIDYNHANENAKSMYNSSNVKSSLLTVRQWDTIMKWIENVGGLTDSTSWGNYLGTNVTNISEYSTKGVNWVSVDSITKGDEDIWLLKTGHSNYTKMKNIYDLAGNLWEWTGEKYGEQYMRRGGNFNNPISSGNAKVISGWYNDSDYTAFNVGFRVVLYVM